MSEPMIQTQDLTKIYGDLTAVDHLNMTVDEGEIFGFLGPNGSGKTTTILLLLGLSTPASGTAMVGGYDVVKNSREVRKIAGSLPEFAGYYENLTAKQYLDYIGQLNDLPLIERERRTTDLLAEVGLTKWGDGKVETFSRGMKQRLGIAQALMKDPKVVFLDEPTIGLDPEGIKEIRDLIFRLNKERGLTVFLSSHLLHEVQVTCSRVGIIRQGKLVATDTIENFTKELAGKEEKSIEFKLVNLTPKLLKELKDIDGVTSVTKENDRLYVHMAEDNTEEVSKTITKNGAIILLMKPREYTLEEVFMKYYQEA
ncbi:MAG: ABC transporter ATP-binding protein [Methanocellales archaeon]|nr:ABC transporter ATP-binding protein [Methanocellales archaeon]MDD3292295.1 ABC transporter ATP-binding protein [Methanocellales archaeon]MDD5235595.1 ABC transporter ATP-binding protein [Methanocellales archaeon]MDD5485758.1 ABC transporter ATP-binding protein [Methanocellales archaeon]